MCLKKGPAKIIERRCISTGSIMNTKSMVRFVVGPDGGAVPDVFCKLPGKGMWVSSKKSSLDRALSKNLFSVVSKKPVLINNNLSIDGILKIFEYILREQLGISKLILYANDSEKWNCILHFGGKRLNKKINVEKELTHIKDITVIESSSIKTLNSFDIVIPIFHKKIALAYLLVGDLEDDVIAISPGIKHMPFIQTLASIIVVAIENKRYSKDLSFIDTRFCYPFFGIFHFLLSFHILVFLIHFSTKTSLE